MRASLRRLRLLPGGLAILILSAGCSSIPAGAPAPALLAGAPEQPTSLRLAVAPCEITLADEEQPKGYRPVEAVDVNALSDELSRWVAAAGVFPSVRLASGEDHAAQLDDAWEAREDLLLSIDLRRFRTRYEGHNGWWIPNLLNWFFFLVPSWFVATEEYTLAFTAHYTVFSVGSSRPLHTGELDVSVGGSFDEFDRGFQLLGFISPSNEADNWRLIVEKLIPAARASLGEQLAEALRGPFLEHLNSGTLRREMKKSLALVVGVTHYQDADKYPPVPFAANDARAVSAALTRTEAGPALAPRQVTLLVGNDASRERVEEAFAELAGRARPGDHVLVYFAGYGFRSKSGSAYLLLNHVKGASSLALSELGALMAKVPGEKLLVLDCGFDGQGRSKGSRALDADKAGAELESVAEAAGAAVLASSSPKTACLALSHLEAGLFTHHLVDGLGGAADRDANGGLTHAELYAYLEDRVVAESSYVGSPQTPLAGGLSATNFELTLVAGAEE